MVQVTVCVPTSKRSVRSSIVIIVPTGALGVTGTGSSELI